MTTEPQGGKGPRKKGSNAEYAGIVLLTQDGLAEVLGLSKRALLYRAANGESMPRAVRIGRSVRYRPKDIESWLDSLQEEEEAGTHED